MINKLVSSFNFDVDLKGKNPEFKLLNYLSANGCAVIRNHDIPIDLVRETVTIWKDFFSSSEKMDFLRTDESDEGFIPVNVETAEKGQLADYKELYQTHYKGTFPNNIDIVSTLKLFDSLVELSQKIIFLIHSGLPISIKNNMPMSLPAMTEKSLNHLLRIIHYPPINEHIHIPRAAPHTDICLFTTVFGSTFHGLELQDITTGEWFEPQVDDDSIVVFNSEMLEICTRGYLKAVNHCVKANPNNHNGSRFSIPMGFHPRRQVLLDKNVTAINHLKKRLNEMGYDGNVLSDDDCVAQS